MTTRSVDNYNTVENYGDEVYILVSENAVNNVSKRNNFGEISVWTGSTWALEGSTSIGIGSNAGFFQQGRNSIAIGVNAARHNQGTGCIALGFNSARTHQASSSIAIGLNCGSNTQGTNSIAIGNVAGEINQGPNCIAKEWRAGKFSQGKNSIAIGFNTALTSQPNNSIIINSSAAILNGITSSSWNIFPIRNVVTGGSTNNFLYYDDTNKGVVQASNLSFTNPVSFSSGNVTQPSIHFGTLNSGLFSSTANSWNFTTAGVQRLDLTSARRNSSIPIQLPSGAQGTPSLYSTETNSGVYRPGLKNIRISTNAILRLNVGTSVITSALGLALPTSGGTSTSLDYYKETTFASGWTYGNTTIASITMTINRIGIQTTLYVPISVIQTNTNGIASVITINTSFPSRFRPKDTIIFSILSQQCWNYWITFNYCLYRWKYYNRSKFGSRLSK